MSNELIALKREIDKGKAEAIKAEGQMESLTKQLKDQYGCSTREEATALLDKKIAQGKRLKSRYNKLIDQIKEQMDD